MQPDLFTIRFEILQLIGQAKRINATRLVEHANLTQLGFDLVDLVDLILKVEKKYHVTIPDHVPLTTADDFVTFIYLQSHR